MSSEIRSLLEAAQRAEAQGDRPGAVARLQEAAEFYRSRRMERRAAQMERHIDRLEGRGVEVALEQIEDPSVDQFWEDDDAVAHVLEDTPFEISAPLDDGLGFGDELLPTGTRARRMEPSVFDRGPQPADPAIDAWCSFCCKPKAEVGSLIAGPAGAFICASCLSTSAKLLALPPIAAPQHVAAPVRSSPSSAELPAQTRARAVWDRRKPKVALVVGPEGSGKSAFLESLGRAASRPFSRAEGDLAIVDLSSPLAESEETALRAWLEAHPKRRAVLAARGLPPAPVLVLQGEHGEEPVYDTDSLHRSIDAHVPVGLLAKVDAVLPLPPPDRAALQHLGASLLAARSIDLPAPALDALVDLAERSGRGARELAALIARIPSGRYKAR
jgi:hypothetical protein